MTAFWFGLLLGLAAGFAAGYVAACYWLASPEGWREENGDV